MTRFEVVVLPEAEAEIREAFFWYFERSPIAADAFRAEALDAIDLLATDATICPKDEDILRHFPYTVFYELDDRIATVLAVAHQRREPGYWRMRWK